MDRVDGGASWPASLQGLGHDEVGGGFNARLQALLWQPPQHQRAGGLFGQRLQRRCQALLGEGGRVEAAGKPPQLLECLANLCLGFLQGGDISIGVILELGEPQRERQGDQTLLGAVVQVALQPPPFGVPPFDDADARSAQVRELGADLRLQPLVVEGDACRGGDLFDQARIVQQAGPVGEHGDRPPALH